MLCRAADCDHAHGAGSGDSGRFVVRHRGGVAVSWQHPEELDHEREWREAVTHALVEICDRMAALAPHGRKLEHAWRRLAARREWVDERGGET